jgi:predicted XRE-type DNA-binding protein
MEQLKHWTASSTRDFVRRITSDFVAQLEMRIEERDIEKKKIASHLGVSPGRVSQVLNNPGNLTIARTVEYTRALGMKVALIAYDDGDPENNTGPISAEVFNKCWQRMGAPRDLFSLDAPRQIQPAHSSLTVRQEFYRPTIIRRPYDPMSQYVEATSQAVFPHGGRNIAQEKTNVI